PAPRDLGGHRGHRLCERLRRRAVPLSPAARAPLRRRRPARPGSPHHRARLRVLPPRGRAQRTGVRRPAARAAQRCATAWLTGVDAAGLGGGFESTRIAATSRTAIPSMLSPARLLPTRPSVPAPAEASRGRTTK